MGDLCNARFNCINNGCHVVGIKSYHIIFNGSHLITKVNTETFAGRCLFKVPAQNHPLRFIATQKYIGSNKNLLYINKRPKP